MQNNIFFGTELEDAFPNTNEESESIPIYAKTQAHENEYIPKTTDPVVVEKKNDDFLDYKTVYNDAVLKQKINNLNENNNKEMFTQKKIDSTTNENENTNELKSVQILRPITFSLLVLFAFSLHSFFIFVIEHYISATGNYSLKQETGIRLVYPAIVFIVIYIFKVLR